MTTVILSCIFGGMKIIPSKELVDYIGQFETKQDAAVHLRIPYSTLSAYLDGDRSVGTDFIAKVSEIVGWDFEKAFTIVKEKGDG